jgi:hypothetical protein
VSPRLDASLSSSRPANKGLGASLEAPPPAEKLGQRSRCPSVRRDRREQSEHRDALADVDILRFVGKASVPAKGGALVLRILSVSEQEGELERLGKPDEPEAHDFPTPPIPELRVAYAKARFYWPKMACR